MRRLRRSRSTALLRRGFAAAVLCADGCTATLRVVRGRSLLARTTKRARPSRAWPARALVRLTARGRRVLKTHHGRLRLVLSASVREPSGTVTRRIVRVRLG